MENMIKNVRVKKKKKRMLGGKIIPGRGVKKHMP